jgi:hypothetical protein
MFMEQKPDTRIVCRTVECRAPSRLGDFVALATQGDGDGVAKADAANSRRLAPPLAPLSPLSLPGLTRQSMMMLSARRSYDHSSCSV